MMLRLWQYSLNLGPCTQLPDLHGDQCQAHHGTLCVSLALGLNKAITITIVNMYATPYLVQISGASQNKGAFKQIRFTIQLQGQPTSRIQLFSDDHKALFFPNNFNYQVYKTDISLYSIQFKSQQLMLPLFKISRPGDKSWYIHLTISSSVSYGDLPKMTAQMPAG